MTTYYAPAVSTPVVPAPATTYYAPAATPVTTYAPAAVTPVTTYSAVPVVYARPVVVRTKVYIPGQPIRNMLRAITP